MKIVKKYKIASDSTASTYGGASVNVVELHRRGVMFDTMEEAFAEIDKVYYGNRLYVIEIYKKE